MPDAVAIGARLAPAPPLGKRGPVGENPGRAAVAHRRPDAGGLVVGGDHQRAERVEAGAADRDPAVAPLGEHRVLLRTLQPGEGADPTAEEEPGEPVVEQPEQLLELLL